jgi:hypothetical protein
MHQLTWGRGRESVRARLDKEADRNRATMLQKDSELRELQGKLDRVVSFITLPLQSTSDRAHRMRN